MSTSKPQPPGGQGPADAGAASANSSYTRFIPREELRSFSAWTPGSIEDPNGPRTAPGQSPAGGGVHKAPFAVRAGVAGAQTDSRKARPVGSPTGVQIGGVPGQEPVAPPPAEPEKPAVDVEAMTREARQSGYQDGYRDGLAALESYKQAQSAQMASFMSDQVGALVSDLHQRLESLEQQLSGRIAGVALELARQVVRSEITLRPELVVTVAEEAMATLLTSAREVTLRLSPEDHALAHGALQEQLRARGARLIADPHISQGGCLVESDIAVVDASVEARWHRAAAAMGMAVQWDGSVTPPAPGTDPWQDGEPGHVEGDTP